MASESNTELNDVYILDEDGNPLKRFFVENVSIDRKSGLISAPIELGEKRFDNKVLEPITIDVTGYVMSEDFEDLFDELDEMYENRSYKFYSIQTKHKTFKNMCLQNMPEKQEAEKFDVCYLTLHFQQMIITNVGVMPTPANAADKATTQGATKGAVKVS